MTAANRHFSVPDGYEVTRDGRVISHKKRAPKELKQWTNGSGYGYPCVYVYVNNRRKNYAVYRLVAAAHLPPRPSLRHFILHENDDRKAVHADQLRWGTATENKYDAWRKRRQAQRAAQFPIDGQVYF